MAPQYAPSLRSRLPLVAFLLETIFILLFVFFVKIEQNVHIANNGNAFLSAEFQDIHVMIFMGGSGFSVLLAAMAIQWAVLMNGFLLPQRHHRRELHISMKRYIHYSSYICSGCHGKTSPVQLLLMALVEVTGFVVNHWILRTLLSSIMLLHVFGALFVHEKEKTENILPFSLPHMFLWMFWPSFNSTLVGDHKWERGLKLTVIYGTYLSLAVSVVMALSVSMLTSSKGKMNMVSGCRNNSHIATSSHTLGFRYMKINPHRSQNFYFVNSNFEFFSSQSRLLCRRIENSECCNI
uniref:Rh blood group, D antigen n=1 Tax=Sinocyclocheilus grahami TaxID=75366 RepID=A0A672RQW6_SINGR